MLKLIAILLCFNASAQVPVDGFFIGEKEEQVALSGTSGTIAYDRTQNVIFCLADAKPLKEIQNWVNVYDTFWDDKLDMLGKHLDNKKA